MPERDELDQLIDSELARYAEPRAGLEQRILARVEAESPVRSWVFGRWRNWALAGAIAALALAMIAVPLLRNPHRETAVSTAHTTSADRGSVAVAKTAIPEIHVQTPQVKKPAKVANNAARESKSIAVREQVQCPKLAVFPAPQQLSAQEQSLVELTTRLPKAEQAKLFSDHKSQDALIEISAIKISPITMPDLGGN